MASPARTLVLNPYDGIDWQRAQVCKAALHLHTQQSDGYQPVSQVIDSYRRAGFTVFSITDHDWNRPNARVEWKELPPEKASPYPLEPRPHNFPANPTWPWTDYGCASPEELGVVGIQGNELTFRHHINSYFCDYGVWYERTGSGAPYGGIVDEHGKEVQEDDQLAAIQAADGLATINHPSIPNHHAWWDRKSLEWYVERFRNHPQSFLFGLEVSNCEREVCEYDEGLWDQLLARFMPDRPIWGVGSDDTHDLSHARQSHTVFYLDAPSPASVRQAMLSGGFAFCSSTKKLDYLQAPDDAIAFPRLLSVTADQTAGSLRLDAQDYDEIHWISSPESLAPVADYRTSDRPWPMGTVVHTGATLDYRATPGIGTYVRAELIRQEGEHLHRTFTNPFGFQPT